MDTRGNGKIYLLEYDDNQIVGSKLPSKGQVLRVLFYNLRKVKLDLRTSSYLAVKEVELFWDKARIPTQNRDKCVLKVEALYNEWKMLQKTFKRSTPLQRERESHFLEEMNNLFDIAAADALNIIKIEEDRLFLLSQRKKGRVGVMIGSDRTLFEKEKRSNLRREKEAMLRETYATQTFQNNLMENGPSDDSELDTDSSPEYAEPSFDKKSERKKVSGMKNFITEKLVATLDKCKISDRDCVRIIIATAQALNHDVKKLVISKTSIRNCRKKYRSQIARKLTNEFKNKEHHAVTVHWDGKILPTITQKEKVDRLPIVITSAGAEQLLGVPMLDSGTGKNQAEAIFDLLEEYELIDTVQALCFDTTATNTGRLNGSCVILEQKLKRNLLYLPCRHHIFEIILRSAFEQYSFEAKGPTVAIFHRFQIKWLKMKKENFLSGTKDDKIVSQIGNTQTLIDFCLQYLQKKQPRADYKELVELVLIFLGHNIPKYHFKAPGAFHHARWMAKAIYCLKIFLFREEFSLTDVEKDSIREICIFICQIYITPWLKSPIAAKAPKQDLDFIKNLCNYRSINEKIANAALRKFSNHLWFLSPEAVALSFFDSEVPAEIKSKMIQRLSYQAEAGNKRLIVMDISQLTTKNIYDFVTQETLRFFERFSIDTTFLQKDPQQWDSEESYRRGLEIVKKLHVVNDTAERSVKLMEEYNSTLSHNEEEKQAILKIVADYRKMYNKTTKSALIE